MSNYKFDGSKLKIGGRVIANVRGGKIYQDTGMSKCVVNIRKTKIYEGTGMSNCLANIRGEKIYEGSGMSKRIATMDDVRKDIDGLGGVTLAALWVAFVR